nr:6829_t:CDS:10 [Entrophospora candida]
MSLIRFSRKLLLHNTNTLSKSKEKFETLKEKVIQLSEEERLNDAIKLVKSEENLEFKTGEAWDQLIMECVDKGRAKMAVRLFDEMKRLSLPFTKGTFTTILNGLADYRISPQLVEYATSLIKQLVQSSESRPEIKLEIDHINSLLKICYRSKHFQLALDTYDNLIKGNKKVKENRDTYLYLMKIGSISNINESEKFYEIAKDIWEKLIKKQKSNDDGSVVIDNDLVCGIIQTYNNSGYTSEAFEIVDSIYGFDNIFSLCFKSRRFDLGAEYYNQVIEKYPDLNINVTSYNSLMSLNNLSFQYNKSIEIYNQKFKNSKIIQNSETIELLITSCQHLCDLETAKSILKNAFENKVILKPVGLARLIKLSSELATTIESYDYELWDEFFKQLSSIKAKRSTKQPDTATNDYYSNVGGKSLPSLSKITQSWPLGSNMELRVYISEDEEFSKFDDALALVLHEKNIVFGDWDDEIEKFVEITPSKNVQNNGTLYAHIYLTLDKSPPNPNHPAFQSNMSVYKKKVITRYHPKRKIIKTKNLIGGSVDETPIVSYWAQNLTLNIVSDDAVVPYTQLPPAIKPLVQLDPIKPSQYLPILFINDFWILKDHLSPINETVKTLPLTIKYYPISFFKFQVYVQMDESFQRQAEFMGADANSEFDEIKRMFKETNPILLGVTFTVSILHSIFEFLAFKNDISHWKNKKELTGVSVRTILSNIFFQLVIFLYLVDNNQDTSWMILIGQGVSVAIEVWKIKKAIDVEIKPTQNKFMPYSIKFVDKHKLSETEAKTKEYDQIAFRYLSWLAYPLLFGYAIYSLLYDSHKSWYSFILKTLVGFVYAFGFIMMTPQLFINYKLKSVAHMPWKTLMYKTLGTFVDDLFAFCIKMPTLHRLACLRDDVIFFVYLYQRWAYPTDDKRANEYGQVADDDEKLIII